MNIFVETPGEYCHKCSHHEVCAIRSEFFNIAQALHNVKFATNVDGHSETQNISDRKDTFHLDLRCHYFLHLNEFEKNVARTEI